jgi:hypothetical protein
MPRRLRWWRGRMGRDRCRVFGGGLDIGPLCEVERGSKAL